MQIICTTARAAAEVAALLAAAKLVPAHHFRVDPGFDRGEPITFTPLVPFSDAVLHQIAAVPETQIVRPA